MPELPEVESIRRDLQKEVPGRRIRRATVRETKNALRVIRRYDRRGEFEQALAGAAITGVRRRGKYLVMDLDNHSALIVHLGMSGQLLLASPEDPMANHTHVVFDFEDGGQLRYVDPRTFGQMFVADVSGDGEIDELGKLGLDPLVESIPWQFFSETLQRRKTRLKTVLMDQSFICGIGNIYSDEILFESGLRFDRSSETLSHAEVRGLYQAIQDILRRAVELKGTSMVDEQYRDLYGLMGGFQNHLNVYQQEGKPCPRCHTPIQRARWTNRSTHFCPQCQV